MDDERYIRQMKFPPIGRAGQERLNRSSAAVVGCGALGSVEAELLVRAGVGRVHVIDFDMTAPSNLPRQTLFTEEELFASVPKSSAAAARLAQINSRIEVKGIVAEVNAHTVSDLLAGFDVILDGSDNPETRFTVNRFAVENEVPWIYCGIVGAEGMLMPVLPGETGCLACVFGGVPADGRCELPTCRESGVVGGAAWAMASMAVVEATKLLVGARYSVRRGLSRFHFWDNTCETYDLGAKPDPDCPVCAAR